MEEDIPSMLASTTRVISKRKRRPREFLRRHELDCIAHDCQAYEKTATWQACLTTMNVHEDDVLLVTTALRAIPYPSAEAKTSSSPILSPTPRIGPKEVALMTDTKYGMFRVEEVLSRNSILLPRPLDAKDIFIAQPTSIGAKLKKLFIESFLDHYMPENHVVNWDPQWRLVWPTMDFEQIHLASSSTSFLTSPSRVLLFLNPASFDNMEEGIKSKFTTFVPNRAPKIQPITSVMGPHTKLYMRLMGQPIVAMSPSSDACSCCELAWCLLTSACLSRGAQGEAFAERCCHVCSSVRQRYVKCTNFEIGVLLHSTKERQYKALDSRCSLHNRSDFSHPEALPISFDLFYNESYHDEKGTLRFSPFTREAD